MKVFISAKNIPLGYVTPPFPSLSLAFGTTGAKYLYFANDIWTFTVYWVMIFFIASYALVGCGSAANMILRSVRARNVVGGVSLGTGLKPIFVAVTYVGLGAMQGFIIGAIIGVVLSIVYQAGFLTMNTWVPFCWGFAAILYHICSSYSTSSLLL